jgi:hypothetical protein
MKKNRGKDQLSRRPERKRKGVENMNYARFAELRKLLDGILIIKDFRLCNKQELVLLRKDLLRARELLKEKT